MRGLKFQAFFGCPAVYRRTPQGVRGLKLESIRRNFREFRRTPQGVRGLKYQQHGRVAIKRVVAPRKGCVD